MVRELEGKIAFLDVQIERQGTVTLTSVFCKKTHTDRYLEFTSHHPAKVLWGVVQCLRVRAEKVCEEGKQWWEIQHLRQMFRANSYPEPVVKNNLRGRPTLSNTTMESETPPQAPSPSLYQRSERTNWEDVLTTGSENSDEDCRHSQKPTSEGEACQTARRRAWSTRYHARTAPVCTLERQEEPWRNA